LCLLGSITQEALLLHYEKELAQGFSNCGGNTHVHIVAAPQIVLLDKFVCVWRALAPTPNTHKLVLQLVVATGNQPVRRYCPYSLKSHFQLSMVACGDRKDLEIHQHSISSANIHGKSAE
ncbi:MAG: hypothetical protein ACJ8DI_07975, partial [Ktedonobacteraceae bacterium]